MQGAPTFAHATPHRVSDGLAGQAVDAYHPREWRLASQAPASRLLLLRSSLIFGRDAGLAPTKFALVMLRTKAGASVWQAHPRLPTRVTAAEAACGEPASSERCL